MTAPTQLSTPDRPARSFCILGTAGHIDHGKSALVKALTGTDPDRLPEEQARGMTIVLGFAHMSVPSAGGNGSITVGLVDVPGHERFIKTMVAGASGIDMAMLVVAADDGVMPQTREHVDILHLMGMKTGFIAISKADLVGTERIEAVTSQITEVIRGTLLSDWTFVVTSARSGRGLDEVRAMIARLTGHLTTQEDDQVFRLAIDRVFPIQGRGTVVTGSVLAGTIEANTPLELLPGQVSCKVRSIQSYGADKQQVGPGQRAALNLTGIDREAVTKGMELATPGHLTPSRYIDAKMSLLSRREKPLPSHSRVRVSMGTSEHMAMLVVIGAGDFKPGTEAFVQLRFSERVVAAFGQRFIARNETAQATLGGGMVIRPVARRLRASNLGALHSIQRAASPDAAERLEEELRTCEFSIPDEPRLAAMTGVPVAEIRPIVERFRRTGTLANLLPNLEVHGDTIVGLEARALAYLQRHHATHPLEPGILRDRFVGWLDKRAVAGVGKALCARLEQAREVIPRGPYLAHREFRPALSPEDASLLERIVAEISAASFDPPAFSSLRCLSGLSAQRSKIMDDLARSDPRLSLVAPGHYVSTAVLGEFKKVVSRVGAGRRFKLAEVRDALQLNRRAVQPLLEYLDRVGFTRRVGDERILLDKSNEQ